MFYKYKYEYQSISTNDLYLLIKINTVQWLLEWEPKTALRDSIT